MAQQQPNSLEQFVTARYAHELREREKQGMAPGRSQTPNMTKELMDVMDAVAMYQKAALQFNRKKRESEVPAPKASVQPA
ncbi:MAG: hypothetical protein SFZ03_05170 [Candidatus Melainabacteria bacterium]|nr:hypothetical protein [Candidatus Melainabacteria bacterium]